MTVQQKRLLQQICMKILLGQHYQIQDGERPDHVSMKLYDTPNLYWTFFIANEKLKNLHSDWPMSFIQLDDHITQNYTGTALNFAIATKSRMVLQGHLASWKALAILHCSLLRMPSTFVYRSWMFSRL